MSAEQLLDAAGRAVWADSIPSTQPQALWLGPSSLALTYPWGDTGTLKNCESGASHLTVAAPYPENSWLLDLPPIAST